MGHFNGENNCVNCGAKMVSIDNIYGEGKSQVRYECGAWWYEKDNTWRHPETCHKWKSEKDLKEENIKLTNLLKNLSIRNKETP